MVAASLQEIRRQLREKFPSAHGSATITEPVAQISKTLFEVSTFPAGAISEIIPANAGGGLALWIAGLLAESEDVPPFPKFVLVDGGDSFDPASHTAVACSQLLWVRCARVMEVMKAADLLVRDGNVPFIILDFCGLPPVSFKSIPASAWWRLKQLSEVSRCRLLILAPFPLVPCASLRLALSYQLGLGDFDLPRREILKRVEARSDQLRRAT